MGGYTKIIEKMLDGIDVRLNCDYFENKEELDNIAEKIIFTGQIDQYYNFQFGELEYRSVLFETEVYDMDKVIAEALKCVENELN